MKKETNAATEDDYSGKLAIRIARMARRERAKKDIKALVLPEHAHCMATCPKQKDARRAMRVLRNRGWKDPQQHVEAVLKRHRAYESAVDAHAGCVAREQLFGQLLATLDPLLNQKKNIAVETYNKRAKHLRDVYLKCAAVPRAVPF